MKRVRSPWWMCCGWRSPWCVLDTTLHLLHIRWSAVCDRHDRRIMGSVPDSEDWIEALDGPSLLHHFDTLEPVEMSGPPPRVVIESTWPLLPPTTSTAATGTTTNLRWDPKRGFVAVGQTSSNWRRS